VKYAFIAGEAVNHSIVLLCRVLAVSRSGYYGWRCRAEGLRASDDRRLLGHIRQLHKQSRQSYGALKTWQVLRREGIAGGKHRIARLRRRHGIEARRKRRFRNAVHHQMSTPPAENLLQRRFAVSAPNRVWAADITYVPTRAGWLYLAVLLDLHSRRVVGWAMANRITQDLSLAALEMAIKQRRAGPGLMHHSDQGSQYTAKDYRDRLEAAKFIASMSRKGNPYDNAVVESFFSSLKNELTHHRSFSNQNQARSEIFDYIEIFYNRQRAHATLEYISPVAYEERSNNAQLNCPKNPG
jgi:transposase InsO family protein